MSSRHMAETLRRIVRSSGTRVFSRVANQSATSAIIVLIGVAMIVSGVHRD